MEKAVSKSENPEKDIKLYVNEETISGTKAILDKVNNLDSRSLKDDIVLGTEDTKEKSIIDKNDFDVLYEKHNFRYVVEFIGSVPRLDAGCEYCLDFRLADKSGTQIADADLSFPLFMLGAMIFKKERSNALMGCRIQDSPDDFNHFYLMKRN